MSDAMLEGFRHLVGSISEPSDLKEMRARWAAEEQRERELAAEMTRHGLDAIESTTDALRFPRIGADALERAIASLQKALAAAKELDK